MSDLVYYYVPKEYTNVTPDWEQIYGVNSEDWSEIHIMDSKTIYENKSWRDMMSVTLFSARDDELAPIIWAMKNQGETLLIRKRVRRFKKEYSTETIDSEQDLLACLYERGLKYRDYSAIYAVDGAIRKVMFLSAPQEEFLFVKNQYAKEVENVIKKWAELTSFEVYEHGEEE